MLLPADQLICLQRLVLLLHQLQLPPLGFLTHRSSLNDTPLPALPFLASFLGRLLALERHPNDHLPLLLLLFGRDREAGTCRTRSRERGTLERRMRAKGDAWSLTVGGRHEGRCRSMSELASKGWVRVRGRGEADGW
ncbi:hypothetical protein BCR35DRAFT_300836 [Leucosporidium creatinivorum]|uniref:Uncharacterized protein n=1 Tax=Leucosporidium creatinivorum TaxID=106004 RepID=A0A1Y2FYD8_9BASI|nr:hypothetical protein BCR35DRAFT_300836 [Leucosporidium creatinivorum]